MPKYLIAFNDEWVPEHTPDELRAKGEASQAVLDDMREAGVFLYADGGIDASTAVFSVVSKEGKAVFTDGPFVETKEHLGGFIFVEARDLNEAVAIAAKIPVGRFGAVEVRPVMEF